MKRAAFKRPQIERKRSIPTPGTGRGVHAACTDEVVAVPKDAPVRSEPYRRLVASLPCDRCKVQGYTQACHGDAGKSMGAKTCDLTCWPGCGPHWASDNLALMNPGCHHYVSRVMSREERREYEAAAGDRTRTALLMRAIGDPKARKVLTDVGLWPAGAATPT